MSVEDNKAIVGRWFTEFWGPQYNPDVIDELAAPDIRFEYSMHAPCRGRDQVRAFDTIRAAIERLGKLRRMRREVLPGEPGPNRPSPASGSHPPGN